MSSYSNTVLSYEPDSYWTFSGDGVDVAGVVDLTEVGSLVYVPSLVPSEKGIANSAVRLDGSTAYFTGGDNYDFAGSFGTQKFSIAFWIKTESANFHSSAERVLSKRDPASPFTGYVLYGSVTEHLTFEFDLGAGSEGATIDCDIAQGATKFIVVTWDSSTPIMRFYSDGTQVGFDSTGWTTASSDTAFDFTVGRDNSGAAASYLQATLDDLAIWDGVVLSDAQVASLWEVGIETFDVLVPRGIYRSRGG